MHCPTTPSYVRALCALCTLNFSSARQCFVTNYLQNFALITTADNIIDWDLRYVYFELFPFSLFFFFFTYQLMLDGRRLFFFSLGFNLPSRSFDYIVAYFMHQPPTNWGEFTWLVRFRMGGGVRSHNFTQQNSYKNDVFRFYFPIFFSFRLKIYTG